MNYETVNKHYLGKLSTFYSQIVDKLCQQIKFSLLFSVIVWFYPHFSSIYSSIYNSIYKNIYNCI